MKVYVSVYSVAVRGVGTGVGRVIDAEVYSGVSDEVCKVFELEFRGKVVSINMSKIESMRILVTV